MTIESTSYHEAGHALLRTLEEKQLGPVTFVTVLPSNGDAGCVRGEENGLPFGPRKIRACGRTAVAGQVADALAGFGPSPRAPGDDVGKMALFAEASGRGVRFIEESVAGAEFLLRAHWAAVLKLAGWLREVGELKGPYVESLVRTALETPPQPLAPDTDTLVRLCLALSDVPEFKELILASLEGSTRKVQRATNAAAIT